jgi:hypothetical protein
MKNLRAFPRVLSTGQNERLSNPRSSKETQEISYQNPPIRNEKATVPRIT